MSERADDLIGIPMYEREAAAPAGGEAADAVLAAVEARPIPDGDPLPAVLLPVWTRPAGEHVALEQPLQLHFDLKERFGLPEGLMTGCSTSYLVPVHDGDRLRSVQVLRSVGEPRATRLGTGREWVIDVEHRNQDDELVGVERWTGFGYFPAEAP